MARRTGDRLLARVNWRDALIFALILTIAAVVRLGRPDLTEFKADEGRLLTLALIMSDGEFASRGISSSVGFPNAPMSVWLYALPLVVWPHPYSATIFTGLLSVIAVAGTYWLGRRYWGINAATVAALMLAVSPWAIVFSRKIWAQNLLPVFAVGWAIGATLAFVERRRAYIILHVVCLAIAVQLHPAAVALLPATLLFLFVFRRRIGWRQLILGVLLAALTAVPYLWYLYDRWRAEGGLPLSPGQSSAEFSLDALQLLLTLITGDGVNSLAGPDYTGVPGMNLVRLAWLSLILAGIGWGVWLVARRRDDPASEAAFICLSWLLAPLLLFVWPWTPVYLHYFIVALPAPYLLSGALFARLIKPAKKGARVAAWSVLGLVLMVQLAAWVSVMGAIHRKPLAGGFGVPLGVKLSAANGARDLLANSEAGEVLLVGDGSNPDEEDFPAEFQALLHGVPVRFIDINSEAVFPATPSVVLMDTTATDESTTTRDLYADFLADWDSHVVSGTDVAYSTGVLPAAARPTAVAELQPPPFLANFVRLTGHNGLRINPVSSIWDVHWRTADNPDPADYHIFNHLLDATGVRVAQADGAAFAGSQWRPGDVVISRFLLPHDGEPQPPLTMRVGMYRFPTLENVPVLDEAANPAGDAVEIPLND